MPVDRFVWAVKVASRYVPRATGLTQALGAQALTQAHWTDEDILRLRLL